MQQELKQSTKVSRRPSEQVMRLSRLGSFHQSRLSFMRVLTRRLKQEQWSFKQHAFRIDSSGVGYAVYTATGPQRCYSLVAFAHDLPDELRSDRVIAEQWDTTYTLFDGIPTEVDIDRLAANVPLQEAGRITGTELTLSRANRSVRLWKHVVDSLAKGVQPDQAQIDSVGYLMRTTAVYGSGKFGAADRQSIAQREECKSPFQVEMLSVYLIRTFVRDLVQHMAQVKGGESSVKLDPAIARSLGIGNSTGLGMAPFILNHPALFNNWIVAKEEALAQVRSVQHASDTEIALFKNLFDRAQRSMVHWRTDHALQQSKIDTLHTDLELAAEFFTSLNFKTDFVWNTLFEWAEGQLDLEAQEFIASLLIEPYGHLVDGFAHCMGSDSPVVATIRGNMLLSELKDLLDSQYAWADHINWSGQSSTARAWYVSEEKLEPRLGERFEEPIEPYEQPLAPARDAAKLRAQLEHANSAQSVAEFLLEHPEYRHTVRRIQTLKSLPYGEIQDNTISEDLMPIDMLRCKLSFFGAIHFDPRSDRWVRIRMFGNAPYPEELASADAEFWSYPE